MILVKTVLGNAADAQWATRLAGGVADPLELDHWEAQKNRFHARRLPAASNSPCRSTGARSCATVTCCCGTSRPGGPSWPGSACATVMIIHLDGLAPLGPDIALRACVELGHALGNQHWPALVKGNRVFVPLTVDPPTGD